MKLLRTLAMAAALHGAAAQEPTTTPTSTATPTPTSPAPPSAPGATTATPTTPPATTTSPTPGATTAAPGGSESTASPVTLTPKPLFENAADGGKEIKLTSGSNNVKFIIAGNVTTVTSFDFPTAAQMTVALVDAKSSFDIQSLSGNVVEKLNFYFAADKPAAERPSVDFESFANLPKLSSLSFSNVNFTDPKVSLPVPTSLAYLKLANTNAVDVALEIADDSQDEVETISTLPSNATELKLQFAFENNVFTHLPLLFYQRSYTLTMDGSFSVSARTTELSKEEYAFARLNLEDLKDKLSIEFASNCTSAPETNSSAHIVCWTTSRKGIRTMTSNNLVSATTTPTSPVANPDSSTGAPTTAQKRDSSNTTLTVIVVVISVIAAVLAFLVARRYFWSSSRSARSPRMNERTVGLISKEESHTAPGKLSFISADDTLRPLRLEPQDVSITKSVGAGKLWIGDYQGRKVIIKRVEAESNDSYATKALISQAKGLAALSHPTIVSMVGVAWIQGTDFGVVAEFMDKGTLKAMLMDLDAELELQGKLQMCLDVAQAMLYLHSNERNMFIKRLSSRKVLVNSALECKVNLFECDSCSSKVELPEVYGAGMLAWEAPEAVLRSGVLNPRKMNIFSLGVLISEVMTRVSPYQSEIDELGHTLADIELTKRIRRQEKLMPHENRREFTELPAAVRDLVERCLSYQPLLRPTAEEIVQILESAKGYSERFGSTTSL